MVNACEQYGADAAICDFRTVKQDFILENAGNRERGDSRYNSLDTVFSGENTDTEIKIYTPQECIRNIYHPTSSGMSFDTWGKIYRKSLYDASQMQYPAGMIHEDVATTYQLLYRAGKIAYLPRELYLYRIREGSIMHRLFYKERLAVADATRGQCDFFRKEGKEELYSLAVNNHIRTLFSLIACVRESMKGEEKRRTEQNLAVQLRRDCGQYLPSSSLSMARKILFRLAARFPLDPVVQKLRMF